MPSSLAVGLVRSEADSTLMIMQVLGLFRLPLVVLGGTSPDILKDYIAQTMGVVVRVSRKVGWPVPIDGIEANAYQCDVVSIGMPTEFKYRFVNVNQIASFRLSRVEMRMALDAFSLMQDPIVEPFEPNSSSPLQEGIVVSDDRKFLIEWTANERRMWPRIDCETYL